MRSSSLHRLNADVGLGKWKRRLWYALNWLNNAFLPNLASSKLEISRFAPRTSEADWETLPAKQSPSRALSDLFWMKLPWAQMRAELGELHMLDAGCGSGDYGPRFQRFSGERLASYKGVDVFPSENWERLKESLPYVSFAASDSREIGKEIPAETNLFVSQSAIEHFEEDLTFFRAIRDFVLEAKRPSLQVHLFPSAICLKLYRWHGVRQYTPRTVSTISRLFEGFSEVQLIELGGPRAKQLHWEYITKPIYIDQVEDRRETETARYMQLLRETVLEEGAGGAEGEASFYALLVHSFPEQRLGIATV